MAADDDARRAVLAAVRGAVRDVRAEDADAERAALEAARAYRRGGERDARARLDRFEERLVDYDVEVLRTRERDLSAALASELARRRVARLVVPDGLPAAWLAGAAGIERLADDAAPAELDRADGVVTGCAVAIAETGTIGLDGGPGQGRRAASLVPDLHLCVVPASRIADLVPEAVARLEGAARAGRPVTLVSGPSATSDIELVRVAGVHGPRTLVALLVVDA